jgi:hypothetical protein
MMRKHLYSICFLATAALSACGTAPAPPPAEAPIVAPEAEPESAPTSNAATPDERAIKARVEASHARLARQGEAGALVRASIDAHGGLARWYSNGPLAFRFRYEALGGERPATDTWQVIDTWGSKARHQLWDKREVEFGWDGRAAWANAAPEALGTNARFWALTPYYFVALPFVLADPGVQLGLEGQDTFEGRTYDLVRVTFAQGTGDAPDDYYILYIDRETRRTGATRYVVSYKGFFPQGGHTPEKLMVFDGERVVEGIKLAASLRSFAWTEAGLGEQATKCLFEEVSFRRDLAPDFFQAPQGATMLEGY